MSERYRLRQLLGGGGMAEVYLAVAVGAEGFEKPVAIKRVLPHLARDEQIARMFIAEARLSTHLRHQNIVQVFDVGRGEDGLFMAMELVDGWDLSVIFGHCAKHKVMLPRQLAVFIAAQVAAGLCHAYRRSQNGKPLIAAHRDISPSNILVSVEGEVKVADFGIARLEQLSTGTEPGTFKGKIPYAAPEVIRGEPATPAADQFGLGIVLHKMLVGRHPYGHMDNLVLYAETLARAQVPEVPGVPAPLAAIVQRMLRLKPEERFPSCEDALQAMNQFLASTGEPASADELARFLKTLELPKTPLQLMDETPEPLERTRISPQSPPLNSLFSLDSVHEPADDGAWMSAGPVLDPSGKLDRPPTASVRFAMVETPPAASPSPPAPPVPNANVLGRSEEKLELADHAAAILSRAEMRQPPPPELVDGTSGAPRRPLRLGRVLVPLVAFAALVAGVGFFVANPNLLARFSSLVKGQTASMLRIDSQPSGATVKINGEAVGRTPLYIDNIYPPDHQIEVKLYLPGHKVWTGTFIGGAEASLEAKLEKGR